MNATLLLLPLSLGGDLDAESGRVVAAHAVAAVRTLECDFTLTNAEGTIRGSYAREGPTTPSPTCASSGVWVTDNAGEPNAVAKSRDGRPLVLARGQKPSRLAGEVTGPSSAGPGSS